MQTRQEAAHACAAVQCVRRYFGHVNQYFTHTHKLQVNKYEGTGYIFIYPLKKKRVHENIHTADSVACNTAMTRAHE